MPKRRQSFRLRGYDYTTPGAYFITLCTQNRECIFGIIDDGKMMLNELREIVNQQWRASPIVRPQISLDAFVIMPNNIHAIVIINPKNATHADIDCNENVGADANVGADCNPPVQQIAPFEQPIFRREPQSSGSIVVGFKSATSKRINIQRNSPGKPVWQRNYYERIIRGTAELHRIRRYNAENPERWKGDANNPLHPCPASY